MDPIVTVVIPTLAESQRGPQLIRAVRSVMQIDVPAVASVVVNGDRFDENVIDAAVNAGAHVHRMAAKGVSAARSFGRRLVETPLFGFLDDDDVLLPNAGTVRNGPFSDPSVDIVVTNGYSQASDGRLSPFCELPPNGADGALAILQSNWLASAAAFFRTGTVRPEHFDDLPNVMELTTLGFRLALHYKIYYIDDFTYVIHQDAPNRATKARAFFEQAPYVIRQLREETDRVELKRRLAHKSRAAHHSAAEYYAEQGDFAAAWRHHLASMKGTGLLKYAGSTRHIIRRHLIALRNRRNR